MTQTETRLILRLGSLTAPQLGGAGREYFCRFVRAGQVLSADRSQTDVTITAQALQDAVTLGKFANRAVFVDHAAWLENHSLERLVGQTIDAAWDEAGQAVEGTIKLYNTPEARAAALLLDELLSDPASAPDVGLSMAFYPIFAPESPNSQSPITRSIIAITHIESIDLVFQPAADGRVLKKLQAVRPTTTSKVAKIEKVTKGDKMTLQPEIQEEAAPGANSGLSSMQILPTIVRSGLPQPAQERLAEQSYAGLPALDAAIEAERGYLAALAAPGVVQLGPPPRGGRIGGMLDSLDRITLAAEALIAGGSPGRGVRPLTGIRELYHLLSGDYEMTGVFQPERIGFANVTSSTMAGIVANALNKAIANLFVEYPQWWRPVVREMDFTTLQQVKWITLGGVGELPTVAEGAAYTELTWDDNTETASFVKKGGYLGITLEAIDKDDTGKVTAAPRALAQAAWLTLSKQISAIFTANSGVGPNLADGNALFYARSAGTNVGNTALSLTEWNAVRTAMRKFTELNSGERLGGLLTPKYLLVPPDLEQTALRILASEYDYTYALSNGVAAPVNDNAIGAEFQERINNARRRVIVVDLWTDTNNWAAACDPQLWPTIGVGYRWGRTPEIFSVASPTAGLMFTNDTLPVKVRFVFATGPMDWRGMYKENVA